MPLNTKKIMDDWEIYIGDFDVPDGTKFEQVYGSWRPLKLDDIKIDMCVVRTDLPRPTCMLDFVTPKPMPKIKFDYKPPVWWSNDDIDKRVRNYIESMLS